MAVGTLVSVEEYLHTTYHPDCDYVDGEVQERNWGERDHSSAQGGILFYLWTRYPSLRRRTLLEQRVQVKATRFRIPDVCVLAEDAPKEQIVRTPPILCIEILSPDDRMSRYLERVNDYFEMGVPLCWIIDPAAQRAWVATPGNLAEATDGILRAGDLEMPIAAVLE
ncbi:MAG TPA: Uma2 family endonuclease [Bryobacteraceae bacterium]|jgi:Uma2 family endonuclease|nr:Uma2 family endonuclease [Bryobacteraceae bacterium]